MNFLKSFLLLLVLATVALAQSQPAPLAEPSVLAPSQNITVTAHGPYEDLAIEIVKLFREIVAGQDPETKKELWKRYLEATAPLHQVMMESAKQLQNISKSK